MRSLLNRVVKSRFARDVGVMSAGTLAAQAINVLSIPILTRLYEPSAFGLLGLFYAWTMIVSPAIAAKFDESLIVVEPFEDVARMVHVALLSALALSLMSFLAIIAIELWAPDILDREGFAIAATLLPLSFFLYGVYNVGVYYAVRKQSFRQVAVQKVLQAVVMALAGVTFYLLGFTQLGLVLGSVVGIAVATVLLFRSVGLPISLAQFGRLRELADVARRYFGFPAYSATGAIFNGLGYHMPMLAISSFFSRTIVGHYALLTRVAFAPLGFLSIGIGHVHVRKVAELARTGGKIVPYLLSLMGAFAGVVAVPSVVLFLWAPPIFAFAFGETWRDAGSYLQILMPALALRLVVTTFGGTLEATRNNHYAFAWKVLAFVSTLAVFLWFGPMGDIELLLKAMLVNDLVLYSIFFGLIVLAAWRPRVDVVPSASGSNASPAGTAPGGAHASVVEPTAKPAGEP